MTSVIKSPCDEAVILTGSRAQPCQKDVRPWVLAATILGSSMAMIDGTVVNVALPVMQAQLNAIATQVQWIVESYALFLAALILVGESLSRSLRAKAYICARRCHLCDRIDWLWISPQCQSVNSGAIAFFLALMGGTAIRIPT